MAVSQLSSKKMAWVSLLVIAAVALSLPAGAYVLEDFGAMTGLGAVKHIGVHAVVDLTGSIYTYTYELTYDTGTASVQIYKVQNPNGRAFFALSNVPLGEPNEFTNPAPGSTLWVIWNEGNLAVGTSRTFSYQSYYQPMLDKEVFCQAVDGASSATGKTIGMSAMIPEPGSILAISVGIIGLIPMVRRRRA